VAIVPRRKRPLRPPSFVAAHFSIFHLFVVGTQCLSSYHRLSFRYPERVFIVTGGVAVARRWVGGEQAESGAE